jgi:hypothetical protein
MKKLLFISIFFLVVNFVFAQAVPVDVNVLRQIVDILQKLIQGGQIQPVSPIEAPRHEIKVPETEKKIEVPGPAETKVIQPKVIELPKGVMPALPQAIETKPITPEIIKPILPDEDRSNDAIVQINNLRITRILLDPGIQNVKAVFFAVRDIGWKCMLFESEESEKSLPCPLDVRKPISQKELAIQISNDTILLQRNRQRAKLEDFKVGDKINVYGFMDKDNYSIDALIVRNVVSFPKPIFQPAPKPFSNIYYIRIILEGIEKERVNDTPSLLMIGSYDCGIKSGDLPKINVRSYDVVKFEIDCENPYVKLYINHWLKKIVKLHKTDENNPIEIFFKGGDVNSDDIINDADLLGVLMNYLNKTSLENELYDVNLDGVVNEKDWKIVLNNYGQKGDEQKWPSTKQPVCPQIAPACPLENCLKAGKELEKTYPGCDYTLTCEKQCQIEKCGPMPLYPTREGCKRVCKDGKWQDICEQTSDCGKIQCLRYDPVCGTDRKTYDCEPAAKACGVDVAYKGECKKLTLCIQVITPAYNPQNPLECKEFPTPCDVPPGWVKTERCPVKTPTLQIPTTQTQSLTEAKVEADDHGFYPSSLEFTKGAKVKLYLYVKSSNVYYGGLDFRSEKFKTEPIKPGQKTEVEFIADKDFIVESYWPLSNVKKAELKVVVK